MKIIQLAAEFAPFAKAGGLGEVLLGLSRELTHKGEAVDVILPYYTFLKKYPHLTPEKEPLSFSCVEGGVSYSNTMWHLKTEGVSLHLLEPHHPAHYFERDEIYGYSDDPKRFLYFAKSALEYLKAKGEPIDLLHLHDWHAAIAAPLLRDLYAEEIAVRKILLTIHNLDYQGICHLEEVEAIAPPSPLLLDPEHPGTANLLQGGILAADAITTVSPSYAHEILETPSRLQKALRKRKGSLSGILNGIDAHLWDPAKDPSLPAHYDAESALSAISSAKEEARHLLRRKFSLSETNLPWVGGITRLVPQKGVDLLEEALRETVKQGGVFFLLGSSPIPKIQSHFNALRKEFSHHPQVALHFAYDETLAHQLYAALDFVVVPSLFEPCGLTQLIAMRYGTVPIVRATGGLKDTVFDVDDPSTPATQRNGFTFKDPTPHALSEALTRAFHLYRNDPSTFQSLLRHDIRSDVSWSHPATHYVALYDKLLKPLKKR